MFLAHTLLAFLGQSILTAAAVAAGVGYANTVSLAPDSLYGVNNAGCPAACAFLNVLLKGKVSYPVSSVYKFEQSRYWSAQQAAVDSACRITPVSTSDVSVTIKVLREARCNFAVKSGGHACFAGASTSLGVTIDLMKLNQLTLNEAKTETAVGTGNTWYDVYSKLDPLGVSVIGGRVAAIGTGGLTLGGGISFFSGRYGWACDNVNNYEVVLADGSIVNASPTSHPDLYFALRGGGNNFGIVTRLDLFTFPQGKMWGGSITYTIDNSSAINKAFEAFNINAPKDPYAAVIIAYAYVAQFGAWLVAGDYEYGKPVVNPPALQKFTSFEPQLANTMRITTLSNLTIEFNNTNPGGFRQTYWTLMVKNSASLMDEMFSIFQDEISSVTDAKDIIPALVFQPITTDMTSHFTKNGGNALGISTSDGPLNLVNIAISWSDIADDKRILAAARNSVNRARAAAVKMGLSHRYLYMNYAALEQEVISSYGPENHAKLKDIAKIYDPTGVFTKLQPGYFKI